MQSKKRFPFVGRVSQDKDVICTAGIKMVSLLNGDLLHPGRSDRAAGYSPAGKLDPEYRQTCRESFCRAISDWPGHISLELRLSVFPCLQNHMQGLMFTGMFIRAGRRCPDDASRDVLEKYLALMPLLQAYFPECEFAPLESEAELNTYLIPFAVKSAATVKRRTEAVSLTTPIQRGTLGFNPATRPGRAEQDTVAHCCPWLPTDDPGTHMLRTVMGQINPVQIAVRIRNSNASAQILDQLKRSVDTCELFLSSNQEYKISLNRQANMVREIALIQLNELSNACFDVGVYLLSPGEIDSSLGNVLGSSISSQSVSVKGVSLFQGGFRVDPIAVGKATDCRYFSEGHVTLREAAGAFRLPTPPREDVPGLPIRRSRSAWAYTPLEAGVAGDTIEMFYNIHCGESQMVEVGELDRRRHAFLLGATGTGKSTIMARMAIQDIRAGRGVAVVDPHGSMIGDILGRIPPERAEDVVVFDLMDRQRPLGFNVLEFKSIEERDLIIDAVYMTIDRLYDLNKTGGPIFEANYLGMSKLLMGDDPASEFKATLLEFVPCYQNAEFRNWLRDRTTDQQVLDFVQELEGTGGDAKLANLSPYITSKFSRFVQDTGLRRVVGQSKTSFDFNALIEKQKILLVSLGRGRWGEGVSGLIANQLVERLKMAAMKRIDRPPEEMQTFVVYLDEAHTLPPEGLTSALSEIRKAGIAMVLATQYTKQLVDYEKKEKNLLSSILGNVGTILTFRLGQEDAQLLEPTFRPVFSETDIVNLPNFHGFAKMQLWNEPTPPFSFVSPNIEIPADRKLAQKIRSLSRLKYGKDAAMVDAEIKGRRNMWQDSVQNEHQFAGAAAAKQRGIQI